MAAEQYRPNNMITKDLTLEIKEKTGISRWITLTYFECDVQNRNKLHKHSYEFRVDRCNIAPMQARE